MKFYYPFQGSYPITQRFGEHPENYTGYGLKGHNGLDWGIPNGTAILAAADGTVEKATSDNSGYGTYVKLKHADGYHSIYGHFREYKVSVGDKVIAGQLIGYSDNTGNSTGPHLHFEIRIDGQQANGFNGAVDPLPLLNGTVTPPPVLVVGAKVQVIVSVLRIRTAPSVTTGRIAGVLYKDATTSVIEIYEGYNEVWVRISDGLWISYSYHGEQYCQVVMELQ